MCERLVVLKPVIQNLAGIENGKFVPADMCLHLRSGMAWFCERDVYIIFYILHSYLLKLLWLMRMKKKQLLC